MLTPFNDVYLLVLRNIRVFKQALLALGLFNPSIRIVLNIPLKMS